jgi:hypothetical protein
MTIVEMLEREIKRSEEFSRQNFGLEGGSDFPEIAREVLSSEKMSTKLFMNFMMMTLGAKNVADKLAMKVDDMKSIARCEPLIYKNALEFFYWGIQVGRELEKQNSHTLQKLERQ